MKKAEVQKLVHGIYRIYWKSGGTSVAAVGSTPSGNRWLAPTNWLACSDELSTWHAVKKTVLITVK